MKDDRFDKLLAFLDRLDNAKVPYRLSKHLYDAISVEAYAPSEHWEIDFLADGDVYVERFRSNGHIDDETVLDELFRLCSDEERPSEEVKANDKIAPK
jgi:hypothetical protein